MQAPPTALIFSSATLLKNLALTMTGERLKICRSQDQVSGQDLSSTTIYWGYLLSSEDASTTDSLDLLLRDPAEEPGLDNHWLLGKKPLPSTLQKPALETSITGALPFTPAYLSRVCSETRDQSLSRLTPGW